jgi:aryl-alcohol dehydrogenase-like predicted oxidoreductase
MSARAQPIGKETEQNRPLPTVTLGTTGRTVPRLGLGGYPIVRSTTDDDAVSVLRRAFDYGVRYIDTAPSYARGKSERRIGLALKGYDRSEFYIATKTLERDGKEARREIEASIERLGVEYVDAVQVHEVHDDVNTLFDSGGVLKSLEKAREEGLLRHIGVTVHRKPAYAIEAVRRYPFATALVPINPIDKQHRSFITEFLPVAKERNVAVIAMKVFSGGALLRHTDLTAAECLRYALSQDGVAVAVPGCEFVSHVDEAYEAVAEFEPLSAEAQRAIEQRAGEHRGKQSEWYKEAE